MLNYANTLPAGAIDLMIRETVQVTRMQNWQNWSYYRARLARVLCSVAGKRRTYWTLTGDRPPNEPSTGKDV